MSEQVPYHKPYVLSPREIALIQDEIGTCLATGQLTNGENCRKLENIIKDYYNVDYCFTTSNCTMGLMACYSYFKRHSILMPSFTWISPYLISGQSHDVKFVDINRDTWLMEHVEYSYKNEILSPNGTFGSVMDVESNRIVINDFAHCLGTRIKHVGTAGVFSLAPTKCITGGDGGLVVTNDAYLAKYVEEFRTKCCRMTEAQAIITLQTWKHLGEILNRKKFAYDYYKLTIPGKFQEIPFDSNFNTIGFTSDLEIPKWFDSRQYYEPVSNQPYLRNTKRVYERITCLPSYYDAPIERIAESILEVNDRKITKEGL